MQGKTSIQASVIQTLVHLCQCSRSLPAVHLGFEQHHNLETHYIQVVQDL